MNRSNYVQDWDETNIQMHEYVVDKARRDMLNKAKEVAWYRTYQTLNSIFLALHQTSLPVEMELRE